MQEAAQLASAIERLGKELAESENAKMHAIEDASCKDAKLTELNAVVDTLTQRRANVPWDRSRKNKNWRRKSKEQIPRFWIWLSRKECVLLRCKKLKVQVRTLHKRSRKSARRGKVRRRG